MEYKLLERYRGRFSVEPVFAPLRRVLTPMPIRSITVKPPTRSMHKFDLEVGGTHNYFVDGVMVHNSPETTPGGRALKFYSSVRLDIRRIESLKDGTEVIGNRTRVKVVKNKVVTAVQAGGVRHHVRQGHQPRGLAARHGGRPRIIKKSGAWFTYEGEQLGQGRENAKVFLTRTPRSWSRSATGCSPRPA